MYLQVIPPQECSEMAHILMLKSISVQYLWAQRLIVKDRFVKSLTNPFSFLFSPLLKRNKNNCNGFCCCLKQYLLDLPLVQLYFLTIAPFCCPDSAGYISSFSSNMDLIIISSVVLLSFCEFVFLTHKDGLFLRRLNVKPGCFVFYLQSSCFHFIFFCLQKPLC